jgi:HEAT repeat protein
VAPEAHEGYHEAPVTAPVAAAPAPAPAPVPAPEEPKAPAPAEPAREEAPAEPSFDPPAKPFAYPLDHAQADLDRAGSRDEVLWAALTYCWQHFDVAAVFAIAGARVKGWRALGGDTAGVKDFSEPLDGPSVFKTVAATKSQFLGPVPPSEVNDRLNAALGGREPANVLLLPIIVKHRVVAVVYADNGAEVVESHRVPDLTAFTGSAATALEGLIIKKKAAKAPVKALAPKPAAPVVEPPPPPVHAAPAAVEAPEPVPPPIPRAEPAVEAAPPPAPPHEHETSVDEAGLDDIDKAIAVQGEPAAAAGPVAPPAPALAGEVRRVEEPVPPPPSIAAAAREDEEARAAAAQISERVTVDARVVAPGTQAPAASDEAAAFEEFKHEKEAERLFLALEASGRGILDDSFNKIVELGEAAIAVLAPRFPGRLRIDPLSQTQRDVAEVEEHSDLIRLLIAIGRPAVEPLCQLTRDPDVNKRFYAVFTFSKLRYPEAIPFLLDRIFDSSPKVRLIALDVLSRFRAFPKFATVTARLRSEVISNDPARQRIAAIALGQFKDAESIPQLIKLVGARDEDLAEAAVQALIDLTKQHFGDSERKWMSWWRDNKDVPRVRWLIEGLKHKEEDVRFMAIEELRELTGNFFSFFADAPKKERDKAVEKWESWFKNEYKPKA